VSIHSTPAGLSPKGACGDVVRNVTGCPLAGVAAGRIRSTPDLSRWQKSSHFLAGNADFYNLPPQIQDLRHRLPVLVQRPEN